MKKNFTILLIFMSFLSLSCQNNNGMKERELQAKEKELAIREKELKLKEDNAQNSRPDVKQDVVQRKNTESTTSDPQDKPIEEIKAIKYIYAVFKVQEPKLQHSDARYFTGTSGLSSTPEFNSVTFDEYIYTSEIKEMPNYDENKQYAFLDKMEANVNQRLLFNMDFDVAVSTRVSDREEQQRLKENKATIIDRKIKVFNSYKEASMAKNNNRSKF